MFFISKCSGDIIISYMEVSEFFCTIMDLTNMFEMSLDFAEIKNIEKKHVHGDDIQDALSPSTAIF